MDGVNGILVDKDRTGRVDIDDPAAIGRWARRTAIDGRAIWEQRDCSRILEFVASTSKPQRSFGVFHSRTLHRLFDSYSRGADIYTSVLTSYTLLRYEIVGHQRDKRSKAIKVDVYNHFIWFRTGGCGAEEAIIGEDG